MQNNNSMFNDLVNILYFLNILVTFFESINRSKKFVKKLHVYTHEGMSPWRYDKEESRY